jgi:hypothetical protein
MATELASLATRVTSDTSDYVRGMNAAADAAKKTGRAATELGEAVQEQDRKVRNTAAELERWKRQIDPLHASQKKLEQGTAALDRALKEGMGAAEHARLMGLLKDRYDAAGNAAKRAAEQQAQAAVAMAQAAAKAAAEAQAAQERQTRELGTLREKYDSGYAAIVKYNTALGELARLEREGALVGQALAQAQAKVEAELNPTNIALAKQKTELDQLRDSLDPAAVAARKLAKDEKTLEDAFKDGRLSAIEYERSLRLLKERHNDVTDGATKAGGALRGVLGNAAHEVTARLGVAGEAIMGLGAAGLTAVAGLAAAGAAVVALGIASLPAGMEFQKLQATLRTVGGDSKLAAAEFEILKQFALDTPMTVGQATEAFVKLKALGLDPSTDALRSYGNTAAAMGKTVQDMVEAVADATTGEFERLKEFGIKASAEGGKVSFVFQGVKTTIANNATEIQKYLLNIGNTKFSSGMQEQASTLSGAVDNLSDNWQIFMANIANSGPIQAATALVKALADAVNGLNNMLFPSLDKQVADTAATVKLLRDELAEMRQHPEAYGPEIASREAALKEQEKVLAGLKKEQDERAKLIAQSHKHADEEETIDKKAAAAAAKEAQRRKELGDKIAIEFDEKTRLLDATRQGTKATEDLTVELAGERAIREFLGVTTAVEAIKLMEKNKLLAEEALRIQAVAKDNAKLDIEIKKVNESREAEKARLKEAAQAQTKYAEDIAETAGRMSQDVAGDLFDAMTDPDREASVMDFMKSMFKRIAVEAAAQQIILPIMTQVVGSAPSLFGVQAPPGGAPSGSINSPGFMNSVSGMWSSVSGSGFGSQVAMGSGGASGSIASGINSFGASAFGMAPGTVTAAPSAAFVGPMPMQAGTSSMLGGSTMTAAIGGGFAGAAAGGMVGTMIGNATHSKAIGAGSGALTGAAVGFMVGGPVGAAVGAIGGALMAALGTEGKPSNKEGNATYDMQTGRTKVGGQTGDKFSQENRDAATRAAEAFGGIGALLGDFSDRKLDNRIRVVMGDRDGMSAQMGDAKISFKKRNDDAMRDMTKWFVDQFALQLGQDLPGDVRTALQRVDWTDVESALEDIGFAGTFQDRLKALRGDFGLVDEATESTRAEVKALTDGIVDFKNNTARLGLDTAAANDATRSFVEGLLGMRAVAAPMNQAETAVALLKVRFDEMAPLLREVGINADEAAKGLQRAIAALRDDFVAGLDREFNELRGAGWINQIDDTFAVFEDRMKSAAALGGGSDQVLRNNHQAIVNIMEDLSDEQLAEAAAHYGGNITLIADSIKAARAATQGAAPALGQTVFDTVAFLKMLEREANETSSRGYINQISDQFEKMNGQLADAAKAGMGADIVLANNHRAMVNLLNSLNDAQIADAARTFGGGIDVIAQSIMAARAAGQQAGIVAGQIFDVAAWLKGLGRSINQLQGNGYIDAIIDQFTKMTEGMAIAAREGVGSQEVLTENHAAMVAILKDLTDEQLAAAAARFGGGIAAIAESLIAGRRATEAATTAQQAATAAAEQARQQSEAQAAAILEAANDRVDRARQAVQDSYAREIDAQQALADAAKETGDRMRGFANSFKGLRQSLLTGDLSPLSPVDKYNTLRAQFQDVAGRAAAGDETALGQLEQVSQEFLQASRGYYASSDAYTQDFNLVQQALLNAEASAGQQASAADQALAQAQQQTSLLTSQLDAINGTTNAVLTIPAAMAELTAALLGQAQAGGGGTGAGAGTVNTIDLIGSAYEKYLGRTPDAGGLANWQAQLAQGGSISSVVSGIANSDEAYLRGLYRNLLGREPDQGGMQTWGDALRSGMSRAEVEALIKASPEGKSRGYEAGGIVTNGSWNRDSVTAMLAGGEFVTRAPSVNTGTLATLAAINRTGTVPANDAGAEVRALRDETRRQTAALQDGFIRLLKLTERQTSDISDLRSAQRRKAAS